MDRLRLWYASPAQEWTEALPVGNGRLGAMVFGGVPDEHLQINEDTLWTGAPYSPENPDALAHLDEVRSLIFAGRFAAAEALADRYLMAKPLRQMPFQPAADVWIDHRLPAATTDYRRALDLETAFATTVFASGGVAFKREVFASAVAGVIVISITADKPGSIDLTVSLTSPQPGALDTGDGDPLVWRGSNREAEGVPPALRFVVKATVTGRGGQTRRDGSKQLIEGADSVIVVVDAATSFRRFDDVGADPDASIVAREAGWVGRPAETLRAEHVADHRRFFDRLAIDLGHTPAADLPTDRRIAENPRKDDPALAALYVQYGRYLMLASSRPGTQPTNLQGIWNDRVDPPWGSKYTSNINLQMNYWLPDPANLSECMEPLLRLVEEVSVTGARMAKAHYGARGWVLHHNTDLWRATGPIDGAKWGVWPTGGAWLCAQLWDHAVFLGRPDALVRRLYPLIAGATRFVLDVLVPLPGTDFLVTAPSLSPENVHAHGAALCAGPAMDRQIIRDLFYALEEAAGQLNESEAALVAEARAALPRIPPDRIGAAGQLQEWLDDWDMEAPEMDHRHVSHLYGLYPSRQISLDESPALTAAAQRSLEIRGDLATGWGLGWRLNLWARLRDGDHAHDVLTLLLSPERTYPNMFDSHPPFQIDGNFGGAAGILEMLVQSGEGWVHLLPALPSAWPEGSVRGVCARGGLEVGLTWAAGRLTAAEITTSVADTVRVLYGTQTARARVRPGEIWRFPIQDAAGSAD